MARSKSQRAVKPVRKVNPKSLKNLQPFKAGPDPRRNPGGVPKDTKELNDLIDEIFAEEISDEKGRKMGKLRVAVNRLLFSKSPAGPIHILERRYGKIPQPVDLKSDGTITLRVVHDDIARTDNPPAEAVPPEAGGSDTE